jgi:rRNA maturation protein Nop10
MSGEGVNAWQVAAKWPDSDDDECPLCGGHLKPAIPMAGPENAVAVVCTECGFHAVRDKCARCGEDFARDDESEFIHPGFFHVECAARMAIGGMNHLLKRCTCCGGTEPPDPPGLTKREAARHALAVFRVQQQAKALRGNDEN